MTSVESGGGTADEDRVGHQFLQTCGRLQDACESGTFQTQRLVLGHERSLSLLIIDSRLALCLPVYRPPGPAAGEAFPQRQGTERDRNTTDALAPCSQVGTLLPVADPSDLETRLAALEARVEEVAADAAAARHLAAARDRDLADLGVKVDANRSAINALGQQTAGRFDRLEHELRTGFAEMCGKLDQTAAGQQQIVDLLTTFISERDGQ